MPVTLINLLQEKLQVLVQVNAWQTNLIWNYLAVLDDATYEKDVSARRANFQHERNLLQACAEQLASSLDETTSLIRRCGPLSDSTKQSLEINEEDHGKAIMVFTVVTIIFLPLSFVTSFFGMNTVDIRDMASGQSLFWAVAIPLRAVTMGLALLIGYNGDELRDSVASIYHFVAGKADRSTPAGSVSVAHWKRTRPIQTDNNAESDITPADDAEYAVPWVGDWINTNDLSSPVDARRVYLQTRRANSTRLRIERRTSRFNTKMTSCHRRLVVHSPLAWLRWTRGVIRRVYATTTRCMSDLNHGLPDLAGGPLILTTTCITARTMLMCMSIHGVKVLGVHVSQIAELVDMAVEGVTKVILWSAEVT